MSGASNDLASHVQHARVAVIGGGIAGLVAALECAKVGSRVTVFEASERLGGTIASARIAGADIDVTAEGFPESASAVRALADELGLGETVVSTRVGDTWIAGLPSGAASLPRETLIGIPQNTWDESVRRIIGWSGAWRAYIDRLRPPLTIGRERSLGRLVRSRMGERVLDRMVAPLSLGVYGIHPDEVDVDAAVPGLSAALTRTASLGAAVADLRVGMPADPVLLSIRGGVARLISALEERLANLEVDVRTRQRAASIAAERGRWRVSAQAAGGRSPAAAPPETFDAVIVATPEAESRRMLAPVVPRLGSGSAESTPLELVTLVLESPELDAAVPGDGESTGSRAAAVTVHPVAGTHRASGLLALSRRHPELAEATGGHVLRVSFGTRGQRPATEALDDAEAFALAVAEASAFLGVDSARVRLLGAHRWRAELPRPASAIGRAEVNAAARHAVAGVAGLGVAGAWLAGPGLAQIVLDAREEADRVRRTILWGDAAIG
ncbi:oxygen-dependent protoporphyrinogen oxidase [Microbacterium immunditiarum]|uniref:Oxygen-dependent protoporphyrinogen oxidase n=1 Tax=Microbacterium immunditiarum TaxID=337480 RepID=A0A7Y9KJI6_9MICO|nr:oxygen-dependent protoporphyrinogen oxidase [Microbacterium immunditiarum]